MAYYPLFLDLTDARCVVIGGGEVAARKAEALVAAGARVVAAAHAFSPAFDALPTVERVPGAYQSSVLTGARVVVVATDDDAVNRAASRDARAAGALVNVVDRPELGDFIAPAVVRRGDVVLAVSTSGASPSLAARIRRELEEAYPDCYAAFADLLRQVRPEVLAGVEDAARRRAIFRRLAGHEFLASLVAEGAEVTLRRMRRFLADES